MPRTSSIAVVREAPAGVVRALFTVCVAAAAEPAAWAQTSAEACEAAAQTCYAKCPEPGTNWRTQNVAKGCRLDCDTALRRCEDRTGVSGSADSPVCSNLRTWTTPLQREHPDKDLYRISGIQLRAIAMPLFADEYFVPAFGVPFDSLPSDQLPRLASRLRSCFVGRDRASFTWHQGVVRPITLVPSAGDGFTATAAAVAAARPLRAQLMALRGEAQAAAPSVAGFEQLRAASALLEKQSIHLFPSEKASIEAELGAARRVVARQALATEVDRQIGSVQGYEGMVRLRDALPTQAAMVAAAGEDAVRPLQERITRRIREMAAGLMQEERSRVGAWGDDLTALERAREWQLVFRARYLGPFDGPEVRAVYQSFLDWRSARLMALAPQIDAQIKAQTRVDGIDQLTANYLSDVAEVRSPQAATLARAALAKRQQLVVQNELATNFSERERRLMTAEPGRVIVPAAVEPPTPQEIRFAFVREMEAIGMRRAGPDAFDWAVPFALLQGISARMVLRDVTIESCQPEGGANTFVCSYRLTFGLTPGEAMSRLLGDSFQGQMLRSMYNFMSNAPPVLQKDRFALRDSGWRSDTLREKGVKGLATTIQNLAESANQVVEGVATGIRCANARPIDRAFGICP